MQEIKNKKVFIVGVSFILIVIVALIGLTYAFFTAGIEGNNRASQMTVTTAKLFLRFTDTNILSLEEGLPGDVRTKTFTVENLGDAAVDYKINLIDVINNFVGEDLVYIITSNNGGSAKSETVVPTIASSTLLTGTIGVGVTQTYTIRIVFKETGSNQNNNQTKSFSGKLQIEAIKQSITLAGFVQNALGEGQNGLTMELESTLRTTLTDASGYYEFRNVEVGNHTIRIKNGNTIIAEKEIIITEVDDITKVSTDGTRINLTKEDTKYVNLRIDMSQINQVPTIVLENKPLTLMEQILKDNSEQSDSSINFAAISSSTNGQGLYYTDDATVSTYGEDGERIYYFRGDVDNNWVSFAGYYWRIVRTTSEDGIRLVYSGDGATETSAFINTSTSFYGTLNNKNYVGYTFNPSGYEILPQTNSNIKTIIDTWYTGSGSNNISTNYGSYLSNVAIYCADRSSEKSFNGANWSTGDVYYPAHNRIVNLRRPSFSCSETNKSRYTVDSSSGNGWLQNPIALLSADEVSYAGLVDYSLSQFSVTPYIIDNTTGENYWWTMSPYSYTSNGHASVWGVSTRGYLNNGYADNNTLWIRPAVSLKSCVTVTGGNGGSGANAYTISNANC